MSDTRFVLLLLEKQTIHGGIDDQLVVKVSDIYTIRKKGSEWLVDLTGGHTFVLRDGCNAEQLLRILNQ